MWLCNSTIAVMDIWPNCQLPFESEQNVKNWLFWCKRGMVYVTAESMANFCYDFFVDQLYHKSVIYWSKRSDGGNIVLGKYNIVEF